MVETHLERALEKLADAERLRTEAAALLGAVDGTGFHELLGYVSLERLVAHRTRSGNGEARHLVQTARHLDRFPATADALAAGLIGWSAAEVLAQAAVGLDDAYGADEAELLAAAEGREVADLERVCRLWRDRADTDAAGEDAERRYHQRGVWLQYRFDGTCTGQISLDADSADIVTRALTTTPDPIGSITTPRTTAQRRADRLTDLCHNALGHNDGDSALGDDQGPDRCSGGSRATVDVVIDVHTLVGTNDNIAQARAELTGGAPISGPALDRLLCDASFRAIVLDGPRAVLAYNRATPDISPALRRAVRIRDRHCVFHGCDRPWQWCDLHHLLPRHRGGPTNEDNLALVCRYHHRLIHEGGWQLTRAPDRTHHTTSP